MGLMVGHPGRRADAGIRIAAPVQRIRGLRLAASPLVASVGRALVAAVLIGFAGMGPNRAPAPRFDPARGAVARGATCRCGSRISAISATCGSSTRCGRGSACSSPRASRSSLPADGAATAAKLAAFATIAAGAIGSVGAGLFADRLGRTTLTIAAMAISGTCAATIGFLYGGAPSWLVALGLDLGHQHRRGLGAVLGVDRGACPTASGSARC